MSDQLRSFSLEKIERDGYNYILKNINFNEGESILFYGNFSEYTDAQPYIKIPPFNKQVNADILLYKSTDVHFSKIKFIFNENIFDENEYIKEYLKIYASYYKYNIFMLCILDGQEYDLIHIKNSNEIYTEGDEYPYDTDKFIHLGLDNQEQYNNSYALDFKVKTYANILEAEVIPRKYRIKLEDKKEQNGGIISVDGYLYAYGKSNNIKIKIIEEKDKYNVEINENYDPSILYEIKYIWKLPNYKDKFNNKIKYIFNDKTIEE